MLALLFYIQLVVRANTPTKSKVTTYHFENKA